MKETGIIMSGDHPGKILDGTKTMTRRTYGLEIINLHPEGWYVVWNEGDLWAFSNEAEEEALTLKCPYGQAGDRLWVRENYWLPSSEDKLAGIDIQYDADINETDLKEARRTLLPTGWQHKPSIFMPRWASRITLEITEVRVERLQEISYQDIWVEGCPTKNMTNVYFKDLWDSLNAKRGYGWEMNPWVWVISFNLVS